MMKNLKTIFAFLCVSVLILGTFGMPVGNAKRRKGQDLYGESCIAFAVENFDDEVFLFYTRK